MIGPFNITMRTPNNNKLATRIAINYITYHSAGFIESSALRDLSHNINVDFIYILDRLHKITSEVDLMRYCSLVNKMKDFGFLNNDSVWLISQVANKAILNCKELDTLPKKYQHLHLVSAQN